MLLLLPFSGKKTTINSSDFSGNFSVMCLWPLPLSVFSHVKIYRNFWCHPLPITGSLWMVIRLILWERVSIFFSKCTKWTKSYHKLATKLAVSGSFWETLHDVRVLQGCPQVIAHSDCTIYTLNKLCYLLFQIKLIVELQSFECNMCFLLMKADSCAIYSRKLLSTLKFRDTPGSLIGDKRGTGWRQKHSKMLYLPPFVTPAPSRYPVYNL